MGHKKQQSREFKSVPLPAWVTKMLEHTTESHYVTGAELKEWGYEKEGVTLVDGLLYNYDAMVVRDMNHARRMRRAFQKHGLEGVNHYFKTLLNSLDVNIKERQADEAAYLNK